MALTLGIYKGTIYGNSEFIDDRPVSFYRVWKDVWEKAISECKIQKFVSCNYFSLYEIPSVLVELDAIYNWVQYNDVDDTDYITQRIIELKEFLGIFYQEHKGEDYLFDIG